MEMNIKEQLELINQQIKEAVGIYRDAVCDIGISENEFWVWYALVIIGGEYAQQDLCGLWSMSKQTINTIIAHMVQAGYVILETVPGSRNRKIIRLTEAGRRYGESIVNPIFAAEERAMERLNEEERRVCYTVMGKYIGLLKEELRK